MNAKLRDTSAVRYFEYCSAMVAICPRAWKHRISARCSLHLRGDGTLTVTALRPPTW